MRGDISLLVWFQDSNFFRCSCSKNSKCSARFMAAYAKKKKVYFKSVSRCCFTPRIFFPVTEEPKRPTLFETTSLFIHHARALQRLRMAARSEPRWTACNPLSWVASPALSTKWIFLSNPEFNFSAIPINSQLVCPFVTFQRIISFSHFLGPIIHQK